MKVTALIIFVCSLDEDFTVVALSFTFFYYYYSATIIKSFSFAHFFCKKKITFVFFLKYSFFHFYKSSICFFLKSILFYIEKLFPFFVPWKINVTTGVSSSQSHDYTCPLVLTLAFLVCRITKMPVLLLTACRWRWVDRYWRWWWWNRWTR